jgi:hypothetical protein
MGLFNMTKASEETIRKRKEYYQRTKDAHIARAATARIRAKERWQGFKSTLACVKCGENHPATLDFHHVIKENKKNVNKLLTNGAYRAARKEVTEKCIVLCSNCHRKLHYEERQG